MVKEHVEHTVAVDINELDEGHRLHRMRMRLISFNLWRQLPLGIVLMQAVHLTFWALPLRIDFVIVLCISVRSLTSLLKEDVCHAVTIEV